MLVVGIDPGTATTGYGFIRETPRGGLEVVDFGVILTQAGLSPAVRLLQLCRRLDEILQFHRPESGAVEKLFFEKNVKTALAVGQARGVILLSLARENIPVYEYTPIEVKQAVTGYGGADKNQVQQMVRAILNLATIPKPDDAADALAIAICHLHSARLVELGK
jgi:crossover junction endodeoxyribonuclease RuvC